MNLRRVFDRIADVIDPAVRRRHMIVGQLARHPLGATAAAHQIASDAVRACCPPHHPLPLAIVLQMWRGDARQAMRLARFIADLEPTRRSDVALVFARRFDLPLLSEIEETMLYCGHKSARGHRTPRRVLRPVGWVSRGPGRAEMRGMAVRQRSDHRG